jgi:hypothetical protein
VPSRKGIREPPRGTRRATLLHIHADRGLVDYDARVADYWPEFGQFGKQEITVRQVLANGGELDGARLLSPEEVGDVGVAAFLRNLRRLKRGIAIQHPGVYYCDARNVEVSMRTTAAPIEADGEFLGYTPATIDILPGKIRFLM